MHLFTQPLKSCFSLLLLLLPVFQYGQAPEYPGYVNPGRDFAKYNRFTQSYPWIPELIGNKVLQRAVVVKEKGRHKTDTFGFDAQGRVQFMYLESMQVKKGFWYVYRPSTHWYVYHANGQLLNYRVKSKGEKDFHKEWTYLSTYKPARIITSEGLRVIDESVYTYNADSSLQKNENFVYKKGKAKSKTRYEYTYNDQKKISQVRLYKKNKTARIWNYECNDKGLLQQKDTTWVCTSQGHDNKGRKIMTRHVNEPGKPAYKHVMYYKMVNGKEELNETEHFVIRKNKERLTYAIHYPDSVEPFYCYTSYNKDGKVGMVNRLDYVYGLAKEKKLVKKEWKVLDKKGLAVSGSRETYNEKGLPLGVVHYGKQGKETGRVEILYNKDSEVLFKHWRKGKVFTSYKMSLWFY